MTHDELQAVADTAWMILGPDGFGVSVQSGPGPDIVTIDVVGVDDGQMFLFSETLRRSITEGHVGDQRYNYVRAVVAIVRRAITDLRRTQIQDHLGE